MAISEARRFLLDSMAYSLWADLEDAEHDTPFEGLTIEVGESREVDLTMEDESEDPETLYADLEKETGVKFHVEVDRDPDGQIFGTVISPSTDSVSVTIRDQEELNYVLAKVKEIGG